MSNVTRATAKRIMDYKTKLNDPTISVPGSEQSALTLLDQLKVEWAEMKDEMRISRLDNQAVEGRTDDLYNCRNFPSCNSLNDRSNTYCSNCIDKGIKKGRGEATYSQKKCGCGSWFTPTSGAQRHCRICKELRKTEKKRKIEMAKSNYDPKDTLQFCVEHDKMVDSGMTSAKVCEELGQKMFGKTINSGMLCTWRKRHGISAKHPHKGKKTPKMKKGSVGVAKTEPTDKPQPLSNVITFDTIVDYIDGMDSVTEFELLREAFQTKAESIAKRITGK